MFNSNTKRFRGYAQQEVELKALEFIHERNKHGEEWELEDAQCYYARVARWKPWCIVAHRIDNA